MKTRKSIRILTLVLVACLTLTTVVSVGAASYVGDVNGDGKITAFDAQMLAEANAGLRELNEDQQAAAGKSIVAEIVEFIFGKQTEHVGKEYVKGMNTIYTVEDLQYMAEHPSEKYILMADLDLEDAEWTPVKNFSGTFDGHNHTISNLTISNSAVSNLGFFGDTTAESQITNLALRNVTIYASGDAQYIGLAVGTSRGTVTNYTVTGEIYDSRTVMPDGKSKLVIGALFGRTVKNSGAHTGGTTLSVTDGTGNYTVEGLCADVKLYIEKDSDTMYHNGLVGYLYSGTSVTGLWSDSTTDSTKLSQTMQDRQQQVVDYMNAMATVEWTVPETLTYTATGVHNQTFVPGETYYGLPYNGRNGSLERFLSVTDGSEDGVYMIQSGLGNSAKADGTNMTGFAVYMGNDCSSAVGQAWNRVSPTRVSSGYKVVDGEIVEKNIKEYAGGAYVNVTNYMVPCLVTLPYNTTDENGNAVSTAITYQQKYGIYPVGDWTTVGEHGIANADSIVGTFAYTTESVDGLAAEDVSTNTVAAALGDKVMGEAYAVTRKADALVYGKPNGHARLVVADPVVIRNADGSIDMDQSFLVCTEQGDGLYDDNNSSWRVNHKWSFNNLLGYDDPTLPEGYNYSKGAYLPITIRALRADYVKYAYVDEAVAVTGPATGKTYSNWRTLKSTVIVQDTNGNELFRHEAYAGLEGTTANSDYYRGAGESVNLAYAHGDAFQTFANQNLVAGSTYRYSVQLLLSNGQIMIINRDSLSCKANGHSGEEFDTFVYTPAE